MRQIGVLFIALFISARIGAQVNLVPNPGFDSISSCPTWFAQLFKAPPWIDPSLSTPDLFNVCSPNYPNTVPSNQFGWQQPYNGNGYAGLATYVNASCCEDEHEFIQTVLLSPLQAGKTYCVSFYVSRADTVEGATDLIGAYFSTNAISCPGCLFPYTPQVSNPAGHILNDGISWELIRGTFVAQGGEQYITIGNFNPDSLTMYQVLNSTTYKFAYYYIDEVSVTEVAVCNAGNNTAICSGDSVSLGVSSTAGVIYSWSPTTGLNDSTVSNPIAKPNATTTYTLTQTQCNVTLTSMVTVTIKNESDCTPPLLIPTILLGDQMLNITGLPDGCAITIYDMQGRKIFVEENYQGTFGTHSASAGNYIIVLTLPDGTIQRQKLCVIK